MSSYTYISALEGKYLALTGANGFLGSNAAFQILDQPGTRIAAIVRPDSSNSRIKALQKKYPGRVAIVPCDIADEQLKFCKPKIASIQTALDGAYALLHYAGAPILANNKNVADLVRKVNIVGTENVINIIKTMYNPPLLVGIGSLFETGIVNDVIFEDMRHGRAFRNPYEKSKWKAANVVRNSFESGQLLGYWFRPPIITGESPTGAGAENGNLQGPAIISAICAMRKINSVRYAINPRIGLPFMHVDHANTAILNIVAEKTAPNGTCFHLISNQQVNMDDLVNLTSVIINKKRKKNPKLWGGTKKFSIILDCCNGIMKPKELMVYAGKKAPVTSYNVDNTNAYEYLPKELSTPSINISVCLEHILNVFEKKRKDSMLKTQG